VIQPRGGDRMRTTGQRKGVVALDRFDRTGDGAEVERSIKGILAIPQLLCEFRSVFLVFYCGG
jgi:hypothetical protein